MGDAFWDAMRCEVCGKKSVDFTCSECIIEEEPESVVLKLIFDSEDDRADWISRYHNSGEQQMECYTTEWGEDWMHIGDIVKYE